VKRLLPFAACLAVVGAVRAAPDDPLAGAEIAVFAAETADFPPGATFTVFGADGPVAASLALRREDADGRGHLAHLTLGAGVRRETMRFAIASDITGTQTPNILSELEWKVPMAELRLDAGWTHRSGFALEGRFAWAHGIDGGRVRDSDYLFDNRAGEFSRSYADPDESNANDVSLGAGWRLRFGRRAEVAALAGYALYRQEFRMQNGRQAVSAFGWPMPLGAFAGLDSHYSTDWRGPWLGLAGSAQLHDTLALHGGIKYHRFSYRAEADWNLRDDFAHPVSFRHRGKGDGWEARLGTRWRVAPGQELSLDFARRRFGIEGGLDTPYFADGSSMTLRLNEARTGMWSLGLGYRIFFH
jgi:hypothetical protein